MSRPVYLGDGVYLTNDGYQLWLSVNSDNNPVVALDLSTFLALVERGVEQFQSLGVDLAPVIAPRLQRREIDQ